MRGGCTARIARSSQSLLSLDARRSGDRTGGWHLVGPGHDVVDEAVFLGLVSREPAVAVGVLLDLLDRLAGVEGDPLLQDLFRVEHLLGLDRYVTRGAAEAAGRLVHHHSRVRRRVTLALRTSAEQELPHAGGE